MRYINYTSDFEFHQRLDTTAPFELTYYIQGKEQRLVASYDGRKYTNCISDGDGIIVSVDHSSVQLGIGKIRCTARYFLNNEHYKDGIYEPVSDFEIGIELHRGESDEADSLVAVPLPSYTKGDNGADGKSAYEVWLEQGNEGSEQDYIESLRGKPGAPLTFDDLTEEDIDEIATRVPHLYKEATIDFGDNEDTVSLALMDSVTIAKMRTSNVKDVYISYGSTIKQKVYVSDTMNIDLGDAEFIVVNIVRHSQSVDALVGITFRIK